jgi:acyl-coenzyme A thioesterase PaaI-like protein
LIRHHELCFGCGQANLFGIQLELERADDGSVRGRFFVKQDHQGPPGMAHGGIVTTALDEAMALLVFEEGVPAVTKRLEIDLEAPVPVGKFLDVTARMEGSEGRRLTLTAEAHVDGERVAAAKGLFVRLQAEETA